MKIICAWCQRWMGDKMPFSNLAETHGICPECKKKMMEELQGSGPKIVPEKKIEEILAGVRASVPKGRRRSSQE